MSDDVAREQAAAWLRKAANDLRNIALVLPAPDPPLDTVAFHAQQAAEKALKALLTAHGVSFPRTHDVEALAALLPAVIRVQLALDADEVALLAQLAVEPRYPGPDEIDRPIAERASKAARAIYERVRVCLAMAD